MSLLFMVQRSNWWYHCDTDVRFWFVAFFLATGVSLMGFRLPFFFTISDFLTFG